MTGEWGVDRYWYTDSDGAIHYLYCVDGDSGERLWFRSLDEAKAYRNVNYGNTPFLGYEGCVSSAGGTVSAVRLVRGSCVPVAALWLKECEDL